MQPIQVVGDSHREKGSSAPEDFSELTDLKVKGIVLERMAAHTGKRSGLLPTPHMVINLLSAALSIPTFEMAQQQQASEFSRGDGKRSRVRRKRLTAARWD